MAVMRFSLLIPFVTMLCMVDTGSVFAEPRVDVSAPKKVIPILDNLTENRTLKSRYDYLIDGEIHVEAGVTLTVEDGVTILIKNGEIPGGVLNRAALIFDTGSRLDAGKVFLKAAGRNKRAERLADNGGVWFLGAYREGEKDGVSVVLDRHSRPSIFSATMIVASYLGHGDPEFTADDSDIGDDVDGFSVIGVGKSEWNIRAVRSEFSGDDGFDVTNSRIDIQELSIRNPTEDGMNISSSRVEITDSLKIAMTKSEVLDRDLFDLEVDDGPSYVVLHRRCSAKLFGVFGDEVILKSSDMPQPKPSNSEFYEFDGLSKKAASILFSKTED